MDETRPLRPYQQEAINGGSEYPGIIPSFERYKKTLLVMATGTGKTRVAVEMAKHVWRETGKRTMFIVDSDALTFQAVRAFEQVPEFKLTVGVEKANHWVEENSLSAPLIVVATRQTLNSGDGLRLIKFDPNEFGLVIFDEAHRSMARQWLLIARHFLKNDSLKLLGMTATPMRGDKKALGKLYPDIAYRYQLSAAIDDAWLVPLGHLARPIREVDFSGLARKKKDQDFTEAELNSVLLREEICHGMAKVIAEDCPARTLAFCASVDQAKMLAEIGNRYEPNQYAWVSAKVPSNERAQIYRDFAAGRITRLLNYGVLMEGFDEPAIRYMFMARPTKLRHVWEQMLGRGTRTLDGLLSFDDDFITRQQKIAGSGKPKCTVVDVIGQAGNHNLMAAIDIYADQYDPEVVERARRKLRAPKGEDEQDPREALEDAKDEISKERAERERKRREWITASKVVVDKTPEMDLLRPTRTFIPQTPLRWRDGASPVTEAQRGLLNKFGVSNQEINDDRLTKETASRMIQSLIDRRNSNQATYKQCKLLAKFGVNAVNMSFQQASQNIDRLIGNNRTALGKRLLALRQKIIASGAHLLDWDDLEKEIQSRRGERK